MSNYKPGMLIFGAMPAPRLRGMPSGMEGSSRAIVDDVGLGSSRVSVETVAANLRAVIEQVGHLIRAAQEPAGELGVAHVDVNLAIAADGFGCSPWNGQQHERQGNPDGAAATAS